MYEKGFAITAVKTHGNAQFPKGAWIGQIDGYCCTGPVHEKGAAQGMAVSHLRNGGYLASLVTRLETYLSWFSDEALTENQGKEALAHIADLYPRIEKALGIPLDRQGKGWLCHDAYKAFEKAKQVLEIGQEEVQEEFCGAIPR